MILIIIVMQTSSSHADRDTCWNRLQKSSRIQSIQNKDGLTQRRKVFKRLFIA